MLQDHVVLCGYGRVGSTIGTALETFGIPYLVIEIDPDIIKALRSRRLACIFGDATHLKILEQAGTRRANLAIITLPEPGQAKLAVRNVRHINPSAPILARAHASLDREALVQAGASEVVQPELEASATMIRHALGCLRLSEDRTVAYLERFREAMEVLQARPSISPVPFPEVSEVTLGDSSLVHRSLRDSQIRERFGITVVAITRSSGEILVNPLPETVLQPGDKLRVFGLPEQIKVFAAA